MSETEGRSEAAEAQRAHVRASAGAQADVISKRA
jgi:hypothetical protein